MNSPAGPPDPDDPTVPSPAAGSSDSVTGEYNHDGTAPEVDNQDDTAAGSGIEDEEESSNHDSYNSGVDNDADGDVDEEHDDRGWGEDCGSPTCVAARTIMENQLETKNQEIQRLTALLRQKPKFKPKPQQRHKRTWVGKLRQFLLSQSTDMSQYRAIYRICCKEENMSSREFYVHPNINLARWVDGPVRVHKFSEKSTRSPREFHRFLDLPSNLQAKIFRIWLHMDGRLVHCLSRLDPFQPPKAIAPSRTGLPNRFYWGKDKDVNITHDTQDPQDVLRILLVSKDFYFKGVHAFYGLNTFAFSSLGELCRFCTGIGLSRAARIQHLELTWMGNQYLTIDPRKWKDKNDLSGSAGPWYSKRSSALLYFLAMPRLISMAVFVNESERSYTRRRYEPIHQTDEGNDEDSMRPEDRTNMVFPGQPIKLQDYMAMKTFGQPSQRWSRNLRTLQGLDYLHALRGMNWIRFYDLWSSLKKRGIRVSVNDTSFVADVNSSTTLPKAPSAAEEARLENLLPLLNPGTWTPSKGDWEVVGGFFEEYSGNDAYNDTRTFYGVKDEYLSDGNESADDDGDGGRGGNGNGGDGSDGSDGGSGSGSSGEGDGGDETSGDDGGDAAGDAGDDSDSDNRSDGSDGGSDNGDSDGGDNPGPDSGEDDDVEMVEPAIGGDINSMDRDGPLSTPSTRRVENALSGFPRALVTGRGYVYQHQAGGLGGRNARGGGGAGWGSDGEAEALDNLFEATCLNGQSEVDDTTPSFLDDLLGTRGDNWDRISIGSSSLGSAYGDGVISIAGSSNGDGHYAGGNDHESVTDYGEDYAGAVVDDELVTGNGYPSSSGNHEGLYITHDSNTPGRLASVAAQSVAASEPGFDRHNQIFLTGTPGWRSQTAPIRQAGSFFSSSGASVLSGRSSPRSNLFVAQVPDGMPVQYEPYQFAGSSIPSAPGAGRVVVDLTDLDNENNNGWAFDHVMEDVSNSNNHIDLTGSDGENHSPPMASPWQIPPKRSSDGDGPNPKRLKD